MSLEALYIILSATNRLRYVLKIYKAVDSSEDLQAEDIMQYLSNRGFPAALIIKTKDCLPYSTISLPEYSVKAVLYYLIEGEYPDEETKRLHYMFVKEYNKYGTLSDK